MFPQWPGNSQIEQLGLKKNVQQMPIWNRPAQTWNYKVTSGISPSQPQLGNVILQQCRTISRCSVTSLVTKVTVPQWNKLSNSFICFSGILLNPCDCLTSKKIGWNIRPSWLYLDLSKLSSALHSAGYINRVAPDVVLRFSCPDHSSYHRAMINACTKKPPKKTGLTLTFTVNVMSQQCVWWSGAFQVILRQNFWQYLSCSLREREEMTWNISQRRQTVSILKIHCIYQEGFILRLLKHQFQSQWN